LFALMVYWGVYSLIINATEPHQVRRKQHTKYYITPHMVMSSIILVYFLYTPTSREVISLFSCQHVDSTEQLLMVAPEAGYYNGTLLPAKQASPEAQAALQYTDSYWTSDTAVQCWSPAHLGVAVGMGVPGLLVFVVGLPLALWLLLRRFSRKMSTDGRCLLEDEYVRQQPDAGNDGFGDEQAAAAALGTYQTCFSNNHGICMCHGIPPFGICLCVHHRPSSTTSLSLLKVPPGVRSKCSPAGHLVCAILFHVTLTSAVLWCAG
jgi:hypothetical protein